MAVLIFILMKEWGREKERIFFFSTEVLNMALSMSPSTMKANEFVFLERLKMCQCNEFFKTKSFRIWQ